MAKLALRVTGASREVESDDPDVPLGVGEAASTPVPAALANAAALAGR